MPRMDFARSTGENRHLGVPVVLSKLLAQIMGITIVYPLYSK